MPDQPQKFYLTTPIYYVNARPHIGHAYTTIVADVLARRHRLLGEDVYFLTGTDEHGQKIERSAAAAGIPPQQFADQVSKTFSDLWARMGIPNQSSDPLFHSQFIRTTSPEHARGVQKLFSTLYEKGFIYLASYTGSYCVSDEAFVDAPVGTPCPDCGRLLEEVTEENFFFKLSAFQEQLIHLIESNTPIITPDSSRNEVLSFIRSGLKDLSISRSSFTWGIPVPEPAAGTAAQKHVIYVWLDALANYMTALGYGSDDETLFQKFWPADLHLVGKEITRFHCVYWPAFLLAAGLPLPKQITAHGWLLFDNSKMSKTKGNIVRTETVLDAFGTLCPTPTNSVSHGGDQVPQGFSLGSHNGEKEKGAGSPGLQPRVSTEEAPTQHDRDLFAADVLRYYLLREIPFGQDGSFSFEALITRYNADLANGYGNLVSRTLNMIGKYFNGVVPTITQGLAEEIARYRSMQEKSNFEQGFSYVLLGHLDRCEFDKFLQGMSVYAIGVVDQSISFMAPWKEKDTPDDTDKARRFALYYAAESIRIITALLYPILPYATARVWAQLGLGDIEQAARDGKLNNLKWGDLKPGTKLGPLTPIFPRAPKELAQTMTDKEMNEAGNQTNPPSSHLNSSDLTPQQTPARSSSGSSLAAEQKPSHDPAAPPRTSTIPEPALTVAGSHAHTTGPANIPSHKDIPGSGIFAQPAAPGESRISHLESPTIAIDDFIKIDLRVAEVVVCERIPKADKLLRLEVDLGPLGRRQILSGIAEFYTPEEMVGKRIIVIANLAPRKMRGLESHGMLLAASEEGGKPFLATVPEGVPAGTRLK